MLFCHKKSSNVQRNEYFGGKVGLIPGGFICVLQSFDVEVIRSSKAGTIQFSMV